MAPEVEWHRFDYEDKDADRPPDEELLWITEEYYSGPERIAIGYFDGFTFRLWSGTDDCCVSAWARIEMPEALEALPDACS